MSFNKSLPALGVVTLAMLAACGGATPTAVTIKETVQVPVKETVVVQQTVQVPVTIAPAPTKAPQVTLNFWHGYNPVETKLLDEKLIPAFQAANPGVTVKSQSVPYDDFHKKLLTAMAGGTAPDIARLDIAWIPEFAEMGALAKLDGMKGFDDLKSKMYPGPLSTNLWKGSYYGLPLDTNTRTLLWNKEAFAKAGVDAPPKTIEEFLAACAKLKAANISCFADGGTYGWAVMPWIWTFGGDITDKGMTKATGYMNSPETIAAYTFLKDMLDKGYLNKGILGGGFDANTAFAKDQQAMLLEGPWMPAIFASQFPDKKLNWALTPAGKGGAISVVGGEDIAVFQQSPNKDAAMAFTAFMLSADTQLALAGVGQVPVRTDVTDAAIKAQPYFQYFFDQLKTSKARLPHPNWPKIEGILTDAGQQILRGEKSPKDALDAAAAKADALLK